MTNRFKTRPLSYSQLSCFEYDPAEWYERYIVGVPFLGNQATAIGSLIGDSIGTPDSLVPTLTPPGVKEYELRGQVGDIYLVGFADHYCPETKVLHENKTSLNQQKWSQQSVDKHQQLDMYALLLMLQDKTEPESVTMFLNYIPVEQSGLDLRLPNPPVYYQYETRRTKLQVAEYALYIKEMVVKMDEYAKGHATSR